MSHEIHATAHIFDNHNFTFVPVCRIETEQERPAVFPLHDWVVNSFSFYLNYGFVSPEC